MNSLTVPSVHIPEKVEKNASVVSYLLLMIGHYRYKPLTKLAVLYAAVIVVFTMEDE